MIQPTAVRHLRYCQSLLLLLQGVYYRCCFSEPHMTISPHGVETAVGDPQNVMLWFYGDRTELLEAHNIRKGVEEDLPFLPLILPALSPYLPAAYSLGSLLRM